MKLSQFYLSLFLSFIIYSSLSGQVKIGNNPNSINSNSLLELESTNQGLLPPRVALNSVSSLSPLSGTAPSGMLVFSSGGTLSDGYYYWNGTKWIPISSSATARNNFVLVKSASDFPAPISGVINLVAGTLYEINGTVTMTNKINLNGCEIQGQDGNNDQLVYTGAGELFTGANTGTLQSLVLTATSGSVFNINAGGAFVSLLVRNCFFIGSNSIGTIQGVGGYLYFENIGYYLNTNGVTFQNDNYVYMNNSTWDYSNSNTYEKFVGTFGTIQIISGSFLASSTNSAIGMDISGITSLASGSLKASMSLGTGTYVIGTFSNVWEVESYGLNTQKDDVASGNLYISTPVTTTFSAANTPTKVLGTTTSVSLFRVTSPSNNRLTYTGQKTRRFSAICSLTAMTSSSNISYSFYIAKNGTVLPESEQTIKISNNTDQQSTAISCTVQLAPNDYIEVWAEDNTNTTNLTVQTLNLAIK
jgi:hypothetical protein